MRRTTENAEREINGEHSCEIRLEFSPISEEQDRFLHLQQFSQ
jgi:hypothetical protein